MLDLRWRCWAAEAAGTALLVLGALSAVALVLGQGSPLSGWSSSARLLVTGLLVGVCVALIATSPLGRLSGAHINPAVTLGFWVLRMVCGRDVLGYVSAQLAGALVGGLAFRRLWGGVARSVGGGVTHPSVSAGVALGIEAGMTAILMAMILVFVARERLARWTPVMLIALLALLIWKGSDYTGTSLNPARSAGPAIAFGDLPDLWLYLLGPTIGALAVALFWRLLLPSLYPKTAKLFHDPSYACALRSELPVAGRP